MAEIGRLAHAAGALFVSVVEPVSLAVLAPPGAYGADIAAGEGQPLGIAPQYGGPYLGILASTDALVRQIPGRLVGMTTDVNGRRAYVMTLRAREQDIRRDKAASNICTNQALLALAASIYLATIGPHGLRDVAAQGAARASRLEAALAAVGAARVHAGPYLNEFAVRVPDAPGGPSPAASTAASWPGSSWPTSCPTSRRSPTPSSSARRRSRPTTRSSGSRRRWRPSSAVTQRRRRGRPALERDARGSRPMTVVGEQLQPTLFERSRPGRGGDKIPHPPKDALDRIPAAARRATPAGPARAQRARGRPPLRQPVAAELRDRHGLLPARLVHDEVQPEAQRVGRPPARLRERSTRWPPTRSPRAPSSSCSSSRSGWPRSAGCARSPSSRRPAPRAS